MPEPNHYQRLGVDPSASPDDIKKQYRAMARKFHPDVNPNNADAARQFAQIAESYRVLSDPDARKLYDANQSLKARQAEARAASATGRPAATRPSASGPTPATAAAQEAEKLVGAARTAFVRNKMVEARNLAEQALRYNRRSAGAYEVLGDVCRVQERFDDALNHYTMALQLDPRNHAVRQRMERVARSGRPAPMPSGYAGGAQRPSSASPTPRSPLPIHDEDRQPIARLLAGIIGYAGAALVVLYALIWIDHDRAGHALPIPPVSSWNWPLIVCMALSGVLMGFTMAATSAIRRIEDELLLGTGGSGGRGTPLGLVVVVVSALCFWVAAALHLVVAALQDTLSISLVRVYAAVAVLTALFALPYTPGIVQTLLFGGNVIYLAFTLGRLLGDFFRAD